MAQNAAKTAGKRGRKRISPGGAVVFPVSLPAEMVAEVDAVRGAKSRSEVGREAVSAWLKRRRPRKNGAAQ